MQIIYDYQMERFEKFVGGKGGVDECYLWTTCLRGFRDKLKRGRGTRKQSVFGIFLREGKVGIHSVIYSDGWRSYDRLVDVAYDKHFQSITARTSLL